MYGGNPVNAKCFAYKDPLQPIVANDGQPFIFFLFIQHSQDNGVTSIARNYNLAEAWQRGSSGAETYMVEGNPGEGGKATANVPFTGSFPKANHMNVYRNRQKLRSDYQPGRQKK